MTKMLILDCPECKHKYEIDLMFYGKEDGYFLKDICPKCGTVFGFDVETRPIAQTYFLK